MKELSLISFFTLLFCGSFLSTALAQTQGRQQLRGHRSPSMSMAPLVGHHSGSSRLRLAITLPLRNTPDLEALLKEIYNPRSLRYHHYLTVEQFTEMFGPTEGDYQSLARFAQARGLTVEKSYFNRLVLDVSGKTSDVEKAFYVAINDYQRPDGTLFFAPDREPSLDLDTPVVCISGLNNEIPPHPRFHRSIPKGTLPPVKTSLVPHLGGGSAPGGYFVGSDYRNAYVPGVALTGTGQSVGLFEGTVYWPVDITDYESICVPALNVPVSNVYCDSSYSASSTPDCSIEPEVALDIELSMSMAPGLTQVVAFIGGVNLDIFNEMATYTPLCMQLSNSWGWQPTAAERTSENNDLAEFALQGQSYFLASGDGNANAPHAGAFTADPPYGQPGEANDSEIDQTLVGATDLTMTGTGGAWSSEVAVNTTTDGWSSTGGILAGAIVGDAIPSYQVGLSVATNFGSTTYRNVPDVSCAGNDSYLVDCDGNIDVQGGSSCAAPLWAGFIALANQQAVAAGKPTVGFPNPSFYTIGQGPNYTLDFHDITSGNNGSATKFPAVTGYDLATGWGSPNGQSLINDLTGTTPVYTPTPTPTRTATKTATSTATNSPTSTATRTATNTPTNSATNTLTFSPTNTRTSTATSTVSNTPTLTPTPTVTSSPTNSTTNTLTFTVTNTATITATSTVTNSPTLTATPTVTGTPTNSATLTPTFTPTVTATNSATSTVTNSATSTLTSTQTDTPTNSGTPTNTATQTPTFSPTNTGTNTVTATVTNTLTLTATPTLTGTPTNTPLGTPTGTATPTHVLTPSTTPVIYPNPIVGSGPAHLQVPLTFLSDVTVRIYTTAFRLVQAEPFPQTPPGTVLNMTLTDKWNNPLANGLYYLVIEAGGKHWVVKLLVTR